MSNDCIKEAEISTLITQVKMLKENSEKDERWKERMEDKIDKILWFFLGQTFALIITIISGVGVYYIVN